MRHKDVDFFLCIETEVRLLHFVTLVLQLLRSSVTEHKLLDLFGLKSRVGQSFAPLLRDFELLFWTTEIHHFAMVYYSEVHPRTRHEGSQEE